MTEYQKMIKQADEQTIHLQKKHILKLIKKEQQTLEKQLEKQLDAQNHISACIDNLNLMEQDLTIINNELQKRRFLKLEADENCKYDSEM